MKQIIAIGIFSVLLTSCMSTKKYSTFVNTKTESLQNVKERENDWLIIKSDKVNPDIKVFDQKKNSFIPAILYWGWNSTIECELDAETRIQYIKEGIYKAADSLNLKEMIASNTLEINLKEVPGKFLYENKGNAIILIIAYTVNSVEAISPYPINLEYDFSISKDGNFVRKGEGYVQNSEQPLTNVLKSTKKFTWVYLDNYKQETERMGTELVFGIINQLKKQN